MSDSENDLLPTLPSNVYTFQNGSMTVIAKGPNINSTNITSSSFRNNVLSSTMNMPRNFERQRYTELSFDQRSMAYRRETSPMSMYSDMRPRNFQHSYAGGMSSQRSMYNGRSRTPMSMRSMDSNVSAAADIASEIKNGKFNKNDVKIIKEAINKFMKKRSFRRIEKRRNMRLFLKGYRRKSGFDSGELGSDSSISSDDCISTHSAIYKDNLSSCRSTRTDITKFRQSIKESNMYKDCTNSLKSSAFRNMYSVPPSTTDSTRMLHRYNNQLSSQNQPSFNQRERFQNGFLLPSQRFNQSTASFPIPESQGIQNQPTSDSCRNIKNNARVNKKINDITETDSDQEEIFTEITMREKSNHSGESQQSTIKGNTTLKVAPSKAVNKRNLEYVENECSSKKRTKLSSPVKLNKAKNVTNNITKNVLKENNNKGELGTNHKVVNDFEFLKPEFPVRKQCSSKFKEQLISKSAAPFTDAILLPINVPKEGAKNQIQEEPLTISSNLNSDKTIDEQSETMPHSNSDMSMRPSFIKRKLFSQKMDVTEKRNLSTELLNVNSPQSNVYSDIQREKHKARKVVTNQSCLNRDIAQEDNNLLDLIHKIVPPDRMNVTNVTNKTSSKLSQESAKNNDDDKWDVTSVISMCNDDDVSETYTDEEIFNHNKNKRGKNKKPKASNNPITVKERKTDLDKSDDTKEISKSNCQFSKPPSPKNVADNNKRSVTSCVKSFWDTDFESDLESPTPNKSIIQKSNKNMPQQNNANVSITHNTTSLTETLKYKANNSILDSTAKLAKYNINRNLTIKAFRIPINIEKKKDNYVGDSSPAKDRKTNKKNTKQQNIDLKSKFADKKKVEKEKNMNMTKDFEKKTQTSSSKPKVGKSTVKRIESMNCKLPEPQNKVKDTLGQTKISDESYKIDANVTVTKSLRISKKKVCCPENKKTEKLSSEKVKENKTTKLNTTKSSLKPLSTANNSTVHKGIEKVKQPVGSNKKLQNIGISKTGEIGQISRNLRTKKIDLSSSINTSNENLDISIRSLRSRTVYLSSSNNDSTLEGNLTVVAKKIQRTPAKETVTRKANRNNTKRGRLVKK